MLLAANGTHLEKGFSRLMSVLQETPLPLAAQYHTVKHRAFGFRLLSRLGCSLHFLLRVPHSTYPYKVFKILSGDILGASAPPCMRDELADAFFRLYPDAALYEPGGEAFGLLQVLGDALHIDIAQIEARHAAVRRLSLKKSLQTWVADFELLSAEWSCRQVAAARAETSVGPPAPRKKQQTSSATAEVQLGWNCLLSRIES